jgi:hypothetical protein
MIIKNKKKVADIPVVKRAMSEYKKNPGSLNAAAFAAFFKAKQMKSDIVVVEGNSYGHRVYHLALPGEDLKRFIVVAAKAKVIVVTQKGEAFEAIAESTDVRNYREILEKSDVTPLTADERKQAKAKFGNYGCTIAKNKQGQVFAFTHRSRSSYYPSIAALPKDKVKFIASTG